MPTKILQPALAMIRQDVVSSFADIPVTILSDVTRGRTLVDAAIRPLRAFSLGARMVGRAVTAWCERGDIGAAIHAIDLAGPGDVVVIDAAGCGLTAYVGEILCGKARQKKIAGLIVNGAVRDIDIIASWDDLPVYSLGNTARGPLSKEMGSVNDRVVFGGIAVLPGDIVLGDNDGIVIIPAAEAETLLTAAQKHLQAEQSWIADLAAGRSLAEALHTPDAL